MPLITRRSSTRFLPRVLLGKADLMNSNSNERITPSNRGIKHLGSVYKPYGFMVCSFQIRGINDHGLPSSFRNGSRGLSNSALRSGSKPKQCFRGPRIGQLRWLPLKQAWVKIASARIVAHQGLYRVARQGVCGDTSARCKKTFNAATGPPWQVFIARISGLLLGVALQMG